MRTLSIVGKDSHADEHVVGYYNTGDRMKYWGKTAAFWGGFWGLLFGAAFFALPGIGPVLVAGSLVAWIVGALEGAAVFGGWSAPDAGTVRTGSGGQQLPRRAKTMLTNTIHLKGLVIRGTDGELGTVDQLYFDDETWAIRYLTLETGDWLNGRRVLISPISIVHTDWHTKRLDVGLTKKQVEKSPDINTQQPVSRQHEAAFLAYYGYPYYWGGALSVGRIVLSGGPGHSYDCLQGNDGGQGMERVDGLASAQYRSRYGLSH